MHVLVRIDPTRQLHRIGRQVATNIRIVVAMAVVMQPTFLVEVLALEAQRVIDFSYVEAGHFTVGTVVRRPDDFCVGGGEFLRGAEVVELVVVGLCFFWTETFQQRQRAEAVGFVDVTAMTIRVVFGDEFVALPEELGGFPVDGFADAAAERVVAVAGGLAVGLGEADEAVLAVVAVFGDELVAFTASFADQVAEGVVVVMAVALDHQAVAGDDVRAGAVLHQQVAGRVVAEAFVLALGVIGSGQAGEGIVVVVVFAFAGVIEAGEVAGFVVVVVALVEGVLLLGDGVGVQALLIVVVVVADQLALLALVFLAGFEQVRGEVFTVQVDSGQMAAFVVVEGEAVVVG